jgi:hypothetical protein
MNSKKLTAISKKVQDKDLVRWIISGSPDTRELIIEARVPSRKVTMQKRKDGYSVPRYLKSSSPSKRANAIEKVNSIIIGIIGKPPVMLKSAGALAVRATGKQVLEFVDNPLVNFIRPNRQLKRKQALSGIDSDLG